MKNLTSHNIVALENRASRLGMEFILSRDGKKACLRPSGCVQPYPDPVEFEWLENTILTLEANEAVTIDKLRNALRWALEQLDDNVSPDQTDALEAAKRMLPPPQSPKWRVGDTVSTPHGIGTIIAVHPANTIDFELPNGQCFRISGLGPKGWSHV